MPSTTEASVNELNESTESPRGERGLRSSDPYQALRQASRALSAGYDMDETLKVVIQLVAEFTGAAYVMIMLEENGSLVAHARHGVAALFDVRGIPTTVGLAGAAFTSKQMVISPDVRVDPRSLFGDFAHRHGIVSSVSIPLIYGDEAIGVMTVGTSYALSFTDEEIALLAAFADQSAVAVERARRRTTEHEELEVISALLAAATSISTAVDLPSVLARLAENTRQLIGCERTVIWLLDEATGKLHAAHPPDIAGLLAAAQAAAGVDAEDAPILGRLVIQRKVPIIIEDTGSADLVPRRLSQTLGVCSVMDVPILQGGQVLGIIGVNFTSGPHRFTRREQAIAVGLANLAGQAIIRARTIARLEDSMLADERGSMAREVHDTLAQELVTVATRLDLCSDFLESGELPECGREISAIRGAVTDQIQSVRRCIAGLRPLELEKYGLARAVRRYLDAFADSSGLACKLTIDADTFPSAGETEFILYRVLQEALANVRKHAKATLVDVQLAGTQADVVSLTVSDNGIGRKPSTEPKKYSRQGIGLSLMRERVERVGGVMDVKFVDGQGTTLEVKLPRWAR